MVMLTIIGTGKIVMGHVIWIRGIRILYRLRLDLDHSAENAHEL